MVAFFEPARNAVIPNVVDEQDVIVANTLSSATWSFDLAIGSMLGGIVAAWLGRDAVFVHQLAVVCGFGTAHQPHEFCGAHADAANRHAEDQAAGWSSIRAGFRYIAARSETGRVGFAQRRREHRGHVVGAVSGDGDAGVSSFRLRDSLPSAQRLFGMSLLMGARGIGALVGPLVASRFTGQHEKQAADRRAGGIYRWRYRIRRAGEHIQRVGGDGGDCACALRHVYRVGFFDDAAAPECRGPIFGKSLRRGPGNFNVRAGCGNLDCRAGHRWRSARRVRSPWQRESR